MSSKAEFQLGTLMEYGLLVDFDGDIPAKLPSAKDGATDETFSKWARRVLDRPPSEVGVFQAKYPAGNTRISSLRSDGFDSTLKPLVRKAREKGRIAGQAKCSADKKALEKARIQLDDAGSENRQLRAKLSAAIAITPQTYTTKLRQLLEQEVEDCLQDMDGQLDDLVKENLMRFLSGIKEGKPIKSSLSQLILFVNATRKERNNAEAPLQLLREDNSMLRLRLAEDGK